MSAISEKSSKATAGAAAAPPAPRPQPVDIRSVSLAVLALLASLFALRWAQDLLAPILVGIMLSYALTPAVNRLQRIGLPRAMAAGLMLGTVLLALGAGTWLLKDQADDLIETLPRVTQKVRELAQSRRGTVTALDRVQQAAQELAAATTAASATAPAIATSKPARAATDAATVAPPRIDVRAYLLSGTLGALAFAGQLAVIFILALFLLAAGNSFRRKMVKLAGPTLSQKKVTLETLDEIATQIQRYLLVQLAISALVGVLTGLAFRALGLEQAAAWGLVAGLTNLIPYLGATFVGIASALTGFVQFGNLEMALLVGGSSFAIRAVVGNLLTPWWMGRAARMSPVAVFIAVLAFGWLWGLWGLFLGVPMLMVVKAICDRIEDLQPVAELLSA